LAGLAALDRYQIAELVGWKFQGMAHRKALALRGISPERCRTTTVCPAQPPSSHGPGIRR